MKKIIIPISIFFLALSFYFAPSAQAADLRGRILLQVQSHGEAWYINPGDAKRYYLGTATQAYSVMRQLGLGISNKDFYAAAVKMPSRLAGKILIKVEDSGRAYYVDPLNLKMYYLGKPADAYEVMRSRGLGITNANLNLIAIAPSSARPIATITVPVNTNNTNPPVVLNADQKLTHFTWKYNSKDYYLDEIFSNATYNSYVNTPKSLSYSSNNPPANMRDAFYAMLIAQKSGDNTLPNVINDLKSLAAKDSISGDKLVDFIMAFVQYIPYDTSKTNTSQPNFIYETLYKNSGICSDKTFLSVAILRDLGYGAAIFDYPDQKHSAAAVECPNDKSTYGSGYCYIETTNYFPIGTLPQVVSSNSSASHPTQIEDVFKTGGFTTLEKYQMTGGATYNGITDTMNRAAAITSMRNNILSSQIALTTIKADIDTASADLATMQAQMQAYRDAGNSTAYNALVPQYNAKVAIYNAKVADQKLKIDLYNGFVNDYNKALSGFFQK
ncbi:MAG: transglutaminase-like domain-containing protein [Candidatus Falkowbacteria bacterium]